MLKKFFWVLFCILIVGCKPDRVEPDPIPPPPPSVPTVTLDVPATAGYLQDVTITWSSLNATTVTKSFVEGTEVTGSFVVKAIAKTTTFSITGEGAGGKSTVEKIVSVVIPVPTVTLNVPATAEYLQDLTITWSSLNATTVTKSFVEGTEVTGSFVVKAIAKTTTFSITGEGAGGKSTVEKTVSVKIPTAVDTLAAHGWKLVKREDWKISTNTIVSHYELSTDQLSEVIFFTLDNYWKLFLAGETTAYSSWPYTLVGRILTCGDQVYTITVKDTTLQTDQVDKYTPDTVIKSFYEAAP